MCQTKSCYLNFVPARSSSQCINRWLLGDVQINLALETNRPMFFGNVSSLALKKKKKSKLHAVWSSCEPEERLCLGTFFRDPLLDLGLSFWAEKRIYPAARCVSLASSHFQDAQKEHPKIMVLMSGASQGSTMGSKVPASMSLWHFFHLWGISHTRLFISGCLLSQQWFSNGSLHVGDYSSI